MDITEASILHHVGIVLFFLWLLSFLNQSHPVVYIISMMYLYLVHERYVMRLRRKLQFDERKQANQKRVLSDSETVRWLNHAVEKIWPICMEQIASQKILLPIIPWFLEKYKPWTAKQAVVQQLYLGRNPPMFTEMRVLRQSTGDDHLVLELGMNFLTADDTSAILAVQLRKRLGGMWAKLHLTGMHVEGKVLIGVKFLRRWPFLGRLRVCFAEPPYFQMIVKPIFTHGLDVTELPGIAGWLDKLLSIAFEQSLVQPNMLVVDMEKFASPQPENWFSVDEKEPVAFAQVEVIEASDMKPSDLNGLADPYVKGQLGQYRFTTKIEKKTLTPKWHEDFRIPIYTWDSPNVLAIEVRDKDHFVDDSLGNCSINISDRRDGQRHDMWLPLENIKMGRLRLGITILEGNAKVGENPCDRETLNKEEMQNPVSDKAVTRDSLSAASALREESKKLQDNFEPINIEGQQETGIWVHHPGSEVSQTWEPRKGKSRRLDTQIRKVPNDSFGSVSSVASGNNDSSSADEYPEGKNRMNKVRLGLRKIGSVFHRSPRGEEDNPDIVRETVRSPYANIRAVNRREVGVKFVVEESLSGPISSKVSKDGDNSTEGSGPESPSKVHVKQLAKNILKHAEKSARNLKHVLSHKGSRKILTESSGVAEREIVMETDSSDTESFSSSLVESIAFSSPREESETSVSNPIPHSCENDDSTVTKQCVVETSSTDTEVNIEGLVKKVSIEVLDKIDKEKLSNPNEHPTKLPSENLQAEKR